MFKILESIYDYHASRQIDKRLTIIVRSFKITVIKSADMI